jgi:hypothetical protein
MKKLLIAFVAIVATLSLTSCGMTRTSAYGVSETNVLLQKKNFKVLGQAYGQSKATYVLGFGGIRKAALRANAIDEMSRSVNLTDSQALANVTVHTSVKTFFGLYSEIVCDATANVIEFTE